MDILIHEIKEMVILYYELTISIDELDETEDYTKIKTEHPEDLPDLLDDIQETYNVVIPSSQYGDTQFHTVASLARFIYSNPECWANRRKSVIEEITRAFKDVDRKNAISLREADAIDDYGGERERAAARALDNEKNWQSVPSKDIRKYSWIFPFLDAKGFRYYVPAYMIWTLNHMSAHAESSDSPFFLELALKDCSKERYSLFNQSQSIATAKFLRLMATRKQSDEAKEALDNYWGRFLS